MLNKKVPLLRLFITLGINFSFYFYSALPSIFRRLVISFCKNAVTERIYFFSNFVKSCINLCCRDFVSYTVTIVPSSVNNCDITELMYILLFYSLIHSPSQPRLRIHGSWEPVTGAVDSHSLLYEL